MASAPAGVYAQPPPNFHQHGHSASMSGSFSQPPMGSFDGHSIGTPGAPTPPAQRPGSQHQQMNYNMNGSQMNGMMPPQNYPQYPDPSAGYAPAQQQMPPAAPASYFLDGQRRQIYTAVYSNVSVYEMEVNGVAVMRRRADSWLNATQILKVAGVDKGKRTKVLEKEILSGKHEKVQGGYGKYQGTWIDYHRGREFCRQFGVEQLLLPLLEYDVSSDGQAGMETPTKEQALAAQRRRMYGNDPNLPQSGTYFKNMSNTAATAIQALNRTRMDSPSHVDGRRSVGPRRPSQYGQETGFQGSQQSLHSMASQGSFDNGAIMSQGASFADFPNSESQEPPRKRIRPSPQSSFMTPFDGGMDISMHDGTPTEPNQSFFSQQSQSFIMSPPAAYALEPLPQPRGPAEEQKKEWLMGLFMEPSKTDFDDDAAFLKLSGDEYEMPIDAKGNTALHWAATLARIPLVKKLLERGFNMRRGNSGGETALVAACQARNNLDQSTFSQLLELLGPSIEVRDGRGRTLLHHIAVSSAMKGRAGVGRYYLESLLEYTVRQGSSQSGMNGNADVQAMTLARFMNEIVNAQDKAGDTALNLAARTSTTTIIDQLIEVGADPSIPNRGGLAPVDFGVGQGNNAISQHQNTFNAFDVAIAENESSQKSFEEAEENFMTSIRQMLSQTNADFQTEMKEKQEVLEKTNAALRESSSALKDERARLERLRTKVREREELEHKIKNHRRVQETLRKEITSPTVDGNGPTSIGEADKGLDHNGQLQHVQQLFNEGVHDSSMPLTQEQVTFLSGLERAPVMRGRVNAYREHNAKLEQQARDLRARSSELEEKYKKIIALCTGAEEEKVDELLDGLVQAVISEQKDMGDGSELGRALEAIINGHRAHGLDICYDLLIQPEPGKLLRAIVLLTLAAETDFGRHSKEDKLRWVDEAAVLHSQFQYVTSADEEAIVYIAEKIESTKQHVEDTFAAYQHELVDAANKPASVLVEGPEQYAPHTSGIVAEAPGSDKVVGTSETEAGGSQEY